MRYGIAIERCFMHLAIQAQPATNPKKAIITATNIDSIILYEKPFAENNSTPVPADHIFSALKTYN